MFLLSLSTYNLLTNFEHRYTSARLLKNFLRKINSFFLRNGTHALRGPLGIGISIVMIFIILCRCFASIKGVQLDDQVDDAGSHLLALSVVSFFHEIALEL